MAAAAAIALLAARAGAGEIEWVTDWEAAKAQAAAQDKDLLLDFTGSDWCAFCIALHDEVFDHEEFSKPAREMFVFMELDFPRRNEQPDEMKKQNAALMKKFMITGFPTIYLCGPDGEPYARTGYRPGGAEPYIEHVRELHSSGVKAKAAMKAAEAASGLERARQLGEFLGHVGEELSLDYYRPLLDEAFALDPDNAAGVRDRLGAIVLAKERADKFARDSADVISRSLQPSGREPDFAGALDIIAELERDGYLEDPENARLFEAKGAALAGVGRSEEALAYLDEVLADDRVKDFARYRIVNVKVRTLTDLGRVEDALACLDLELENDGLSASDRERFLGAKVSVLSDAGRKEEALEVHKGLYRDSANAAMSFQIHVRRRAMLLADLEKGEEAVGVVESEVERLRMTAVQLMVFQSSLLTDQGKTDEAVAVLRDASSLNTDARLKPIIQGQLERLESAQSAPAAAP